MTKPMKRETATERADLPHQFDGREDLTCEVCTAFYLDPRHTAWEKSELASQPQTFAFPRETGS